MTAARARQREQLMWHACCQADRRRLRLLDVTPGVAPDQSEHLAHLFSLLLRSDSEETGNFLRTFKS